MRDSGRAADSTLRVPSDVPATAASSALKTVQLTSCPVKEGSSLNGLT